VLTPRRALPVLTPLRAGSPSRGSAPAVERKQLRPALADRPGYALRGGGWSCASTWTGAQPIGSGAGHNALRGRPGGDRGCSRTQM